MVDVAGMLIVVACILCIIGSVFLIVLAICVRPVADAIREIISTIHEWKRAKAYGDKDFMETYDIYKKMDKKDKP